jgi:IS30 family transposase
LQKQEKAGSIKDNKGIIQNHISIEKKFKINNKLSRLGDIEVDFMMGKNHKVALLVMTERLTLYTCLQKLETLGSIIVSDAIINQLKK